MPKYVLDGVCDGCAASIPLTVNTMQEDGLAPEKKRLTIEANVGNGRRAAGGAGVLGAPCANLNAFGDVLRAPLGGRAPAPRSGAASSSTNGSGA